MDEQRILSKRIEYLCKKQGISYYSLSYKSAVPMTTLMHIIDCSTKNPGVFTIMKICSGLNITVKEFFDTKEFLDIESMLE
ncbi:MAG: helix-turn-helix domain-containing protein [Lachnospiraceae bacterium]|nr:helix-turn-helix domain-containing protein [Lachnospiraceae bacterium]